MICETLQAKADLIFFQILNQKILKKTGLLFWWVFFIFNAALIIANQYSTNDGGLSILESGPNNPLITVFTNTQTQHAQGTQHNKYLWKNCFGSFDHNMYKGDFHNYLSIYDLVQNYQLCKKMTWTFPTKLFWVYHVYKECLLLHAKLPSQYSHSLVRLKICFQLLVQPKPLLLTENKI